MQVRMVIVNFRSSSRAGLQGGCVVCGLGMKRTSGGFVRAYLGLGNSLSADAHEGRVRPAVTSVA